MDISYLILLGFYLLSLYALGLRVVKTWLPGLPTLLNAVGAFIIGTGIGVPVTYLCSSVFAHTRDPILWGTAASIVLMALLLFFWKKKIIGTKKQGIPFGDAAVAVLSLAFSWWMMTKTFHGAGGQLFAGSNTIFDSAYLVGLVRSMSWGANIPFASPYFAGAPLFYHFFFVFWVALLEHFGVPIAWAVNIPSIVSFTSLLILIYYLPQIIGKQKPVVGWIGVLFAVTNSSLTFWHIIGKMNIWHVQAYPFAGPFDGSVISIFVTLNNYVNQRHLAFAVAAGLFLYMAAAEFFADKHIGGKKSLVLGASTGVLFLWNMAIFAATAGLIGFLFVLRRQWKPLAVFAAGAAACSLLSFLPMATFLYRAAIWLHSSFISNPYGVHELRPAWNIAAYLWQNLGMLPPVALLGYLTISEKQRKSFVPFIIFFIGLCLVAGIGKRGFDQKLFSFFITGINMLAAAGVYWLWTRKKIIAKSGAAVAVVVLTVSGFIDLLPIKNEFAYPLVDTETAPVIAWIRASTPKNAIFVSYADMIDPVVLAGRTNFFGFYGNVGWSDRSPVVLRVYSGDNDAAKANHISYVLVPKWKKNDFPYAVNIPRLQVSMQAVYQDGRYLVFAVR